MAADTPSTGAEVPCPDPSVHERHNKLSEQASTAALYVTNPARNNHQPKDGPSRESPLGSDGKLSSKGAATSLKYARAQDLPSFPSVGIDTSNSAGQAAYLAKDYKMKDLWQPELSSAGSKAALLAHRDGGKVDLWQPSATKDGNSAATLAMRNKTLSPKLDYGHTEVGRNNALLAATKSQSQGRQRAGSTPTQPLPKYPDSANSARNALSAATLSHRASVKSSSAKESNPIKDSSRWGSDAMQAARVQHLGANMSREMFSERPPVEIEQEEKRHQNALRASAISMAKQMYELQNRNQSNDGQSSTALGAANASTRNAPTTSTAPDIKSEAIKYIHLQEAAHKLASERLAKMDAENQAGKYKEYYGYSSQPQRSRLSIRSHGRKRASSEGRRDLDSSDDEEQARRVRSQMSQFNTAIATVDAKKQEQDRAALLAAAEKNVHKSMHAMDERVFMETGKASQNMMDDWEAKARKRAQEDSDIRQKNHGKTHVGGGKFMEQSEIEAIAAARLKPTLDEINDSAEKRRARDEELRLEREEQAREKTNEKQKHREEKDEAKRMKNEEKVAARQEKEDRKTAERETKEINRRSVGAPPGESREEGNHRGLLKRWASKRKSRDVKKDEKEAAGAAAAGTVVAVGAEKAEDHTEPQVEKQPLDKDSISSRDEVPDREPVPAALPEQEDYHEPSRDGEFEVEPVRVSSPVKERGRPDLERHITTVETSDEEDDESDGEKAETVDAPTAATTPAATTATASQPKSYPTQGEVEEGGEGEKRGIRSFFSRFRPGRQSQSENKVLAELKPLKDTPATDAANSTAADTHTSALDDREAESAAVGASSLPQHIGTDGQIGDSNRVSGSAGNDLAPASPSSFDRRASSRYSVSSLSSSGLEEDDINHSEGRTGRLARALGMGKGQSKATGQAPDDTTTANAGRKQSSVGDDGDDDHFEEARDHFDATLAPEPAFAGQRKSASPARETKFVEEF